MDTPLDLSQIVKTFLQEHADYRNNTNSPYRSQTLLDDRHQRYCLPSFPRSAWVTVTHP
jgi:hypothetical protein